MTLRRLARDYPARSAEWDWLREQGLARPRVGGPGGAESRRTVSVQLRLAPEAAEALAALAAAEGVPVAGLVARWVRDHGIGRRRGQGGE